MQQSIYQQNGYNSRQHYLECMSADYNVPIAVVETLSDLYGEVEDFDGLVSALDEYHEYGEMYFGDM